MSHRIPADVEREDRLVFGLTARQLAILLPTALLAGATTVTAARVLPLPLAMAVAGPVALAGLALALGRVYGLSGDRLALALLRYHRAPRRLIPAPERIPSPPAWAPAEAGDLPGRLELARDLYSNGIIDLGEDGAALVCRATPVNFALRSPQEQEALIAGFAGFLHSVTAPVQILVRADRADLREVLAALGERAGGLPHLALEQAARDHGRFLDTLAARRDVLRRELLLVLREPANGDPDTALPRRAEHAAELLAAIGTTLTPLDLDAAADVLARATAPGSPPRPAGLAAPGETITRSRS
jgi:hypothetical protein